ncbi:MAG: desulfoferrodoxin [Chloroflexi bacterium]|nr:desulfoferrodoxin [Chloroflexota bacterium]
MATELGKRYRCPVCQTEVIVTRKGTGDLTCCNTPMELKK